MHNVIRFATIVSYLGSVCDVIVLIIILVKTSNNDGPVFDIVIGWQYATVVSRVSKHAGNIIWHSLQVRNLDVASDIFALTVKNLDGAIDIVASMDNPCFGGV